MSFRLRNKQSVMIHPDARFILNEIYLEAVYDVAGVDFADCRSVLDLGADVGVFALYVASKAPNSTVYCFEPGSDNFTLLKRNLSQNRILANSYRVAVSGQCGTGYLSVRRTSFTHALGDAAEGAEAVECVDMAHVFQLTGVERFDFVKMDVEGAEADILNGCTDEDLGRIGALSVEGHHSAAKLPDLVNRLTGIGFEVQPQECQSHLFLKARWAA